MQVKVQYNAVKCEHEVFSGDGASRHRRVTQRAAAVFADLLRQSAVFTHTAHPELVLLDRLARHNAGG